MQVTPATLVMLVMQVMQVMQLMQVMQVMPSIYTTVPRRRVAMRRSPRHRTAPPRTASIAR